MSDLRRHDYVNKAYFDCPRCGQFGLTGTAEATLPRLLTDRRKVAFLSLYIRGKQRKGQDTLLLGSDLCKKVVETGTLPTPQEPRSRDRIVAKRGLQQVPA
jgi:hypothetical protein